MARIAVEYAGLHSLVELFHDLLRGGDLGSGSGNRDVHFVRQSLKHASFEMDLEVMVKRTPSRIAVKVARLVCLARSGVKLDLLHPVLVPRANAAAV